MVTIWVAPLLFERKAGAYFYKIKYNAFSSYLQYLHLLHKIQFYYLLHIERKYCQFFKRGRHHEKQKVQTTQFWTMKPERKSNRKKKAESLYFCVSLYRLSRCLHSHIFISLETYKYRTKFDLRVTIKTVLISQS